MRQNDKLYAAAVRWWMSHRPESMTFSEHMANPTVNTSTDSESSLAKTIVKVMKEKLVKKSSKKRRARRKVKTE